LSAGGQLKLDKSLDNFIASTQALSPGFIPLIILTLILVWRANNRKRKLIVILYLLPYIVILILSFSLVNGVEWIVSYSLGISIVLYIMFIYALDVILKSNNSIRSIVFLLTPLLIPFAYTNSFPKIELHDTYSFNHFLNKFSLYSANGTIEESSRLRSIYKEEFFMNKVVLQDYQTPLIWSNFRPGMRNFLIYDDWNNAATAYGEIVEVIILRKNKKYEGFLEEKSISNLVSLGSFGKMGCKIDYSGNIYEVYLCK
jgi:hypothetical protein